MAWDRTNHDLFSVLFFSRDPSAHNTVRCYVGETYEDGIGNGQATWTALEQKYDGNATEARREFHDKFHTTMMQSGGVPEDFLFVMGCYRDRLEEMG